MIRFITGAGLAAVLALGLSAATAPAVEKAMSGWPERAKIAARATLEKYGPPDEIGPDALVWWDNGPWKRTVVYRRAWPHYEGAEDKDYLENTVGYRVPGEKLDELSRFDGKLDADARYEEMTSRSESEAMNFLVLNLAYEIVAGRRGLPDARRFAARTARLSAAGKSSPYLERLLFVSRHRPRR
jgi:hypothetical protein